MPMIIGNIIYKVALVLAKRSASSGNEIDNHKYSN